MTDCQIDPETVTRHSAEIARIGDCVRSAASQAEARVGDGDYGALFAALVPIMNGHLGLIRDAIARHHIEMTEHRDEFLRTIDELRATDSCSAVTVGKSYPR